MRAPKTHVVLNIYDLHEVNNYTWSFGLGAFHSGVEIGGDEYTFAAQAGIFYSTPKQIDGASYRETMDMGYFNGSLTDVKKVITSMGDEFTGDSYNIITRNCNHFANELCIRLKLGPIPSYINRLAYLGSFLSCIIPNKEEDLDPNTIQGNVPLFDIFSGQGRTLSSTSHSTSLENNTMHSSGKNPSTKTDTTAENQREIRLQAAMGRILPLQINQPTNASNSSNSTNFTNSTNSSNSTTTTIQ